MGGFIVGASNKDLLKGISSGFLSAFLGPALTYIILYIYQGYYSVAIIEGLKMGLWIGRLLWLPATTGAAFGVFIFKKGVKPKL